MIEQRFYVESRLWADTIDISFVKRIEGKIIRALPAPLEMVKPEEGMLMGTTQPMLSIQRDSAGDSALQSLMDGLWQIGVRPRDIGTAGHLAATQAHLNDFRAIVAKQLDVPFK